MKFQARALPAVNYSRMCKAFGAANGAVVPFVMPNLFSISARFRMTAPKTIKILHLDSTCLVGVIFYKMCGS